MRYFVLAFLLSLSFFPAHADDNIANCEIVVQKPIDDGQINDTENTPVIATFLPAFDFIFSVFDGEPGHLETVDGQPIKALMCTRSNIIPTAFDAVLIKTGIPFYVSPNFDASGSALMAIIKTDGIYVHDYDGAPLNDEQIQTLTSRLEALNDP